MYICAYIYSAYLKNIGFWRDMQRHKSPKFGLFCKTTYLCMCLLWEIYVYMHVFSVRTCYGVMCNGNNSLRLIGLFCKSALLVYGPLVGPIHIYVHIDTVRTVKIGFWRGVQWQQLSSTCSLLQERPTCVRVFRGKYIYIYICIYIQCVLAIVFWRDMPWRKVS